MIRNPSSIFMSISSIYLPMPWARLSAIFPFGADESYKIIFQLVPTIMLLNIFPRI